MTLRDLTILGCSSQQPTRARNHGAYLVRWKEEGLLFDPGEGTQRQFIFAGVAPTCVTRIFVSHFHGDHCLGLGSMIMRLNLDKVAQVHCYYPASGQVYFERLLGGTIYHRNIEVIEHPVQHEGVVHEDENFQIQARFLEHGIDNLGWRVQEKDVRKFNQERLQACGVTGPNVRLLAEKGALTIEGNKILLDDVSWIRPGDVLAVTIDTLPCQAVVDLARGATLLLCESTYLESHRQLAEKHHHLTAKQAAELAKQAGAKTLILTHFSARYQDEKAFEEEARKVFPQAFAAQDLRVFQF